MRFAAREARNALDEAAPQSSAKTQRPEEEEAGSPVRIRFSEKSDPARLGTCSSGGGTWGPSTSVPTADFPSFIHLSADVAEKDFDPKRTVILARESESCITLL